MKLLVRRTPCFRSSLKASFIGLFFTFLMLSSFFLILTNEAFAKNIGVLGPVYPIAETDLLKLIQDRLQTMKEDGELDKANEDFKKQSLEELYHPRAVSGITTTLHSQTYDFDPSFVVPHDIVDNEGHLIAKAGTKINPLSTVRLHEALLFINGNDPKQVNWALKEDAAWKGRDKIILVDGLVIDLMKKTKKTFYFDQDGKITSQLQIIHVPAIVEQKGLVLRIDEVVLP